MHVRVTAAKGGQRIGNRLDERRGGGKADVQLPGFTMMQTACARRRVVDQAEDVPAIGKKLPARRRQAHAAVGSGEEACANLLFKYLNLLA